MKKKRQVDETLGRPDALCGLDDDNDEYDVDDVHADEEDDWSHQLSQSMNGIARGE